MFMVGLVTTISNLQLTFADSQLVNNLQFRAQKAFDRMTELSREALTGDVDLAEIQTSSGGIHQGFRFRLVSSFDTATGQPIYDNTHKVFFLGPHDGTYDVSGLIIARGSSLLGVYNHSAGADKALGTFDDNTSPVTGTTRSVELLIPAGFAPRTGDMFQVELDSASNDRLVRFTLRLNVVAQDGDFLLDQDVVLTRTVALTQ